MKFLTIIITGFYITLMLSCGSQTNDDSTHTHEGEDATHTHEVEDATHTHEGEDATHTHEGEDATHTHEGEDTTLTHEGEDATHTHEGEDATHTHEGEEQVLEQDDQAHSHGEQTLIKLSKIDFSSVHKTSGQILVDKKDAIIITAKSPGIVRFTDHFLFPGVKIKGGETLFTISGEDMTENNTGVNYIKIKSEYESALANYERAKELIKDKLITQEQFLKARKDFEQSEIEYKTYNSTISGTTSRVKSPNEGYVDAIYVTEGQMVRSGDMLASIIIEHNLVVKADVAPTALSVLPQIRSANFSTGYNNTIYSTNEMNGQIISFGKSTDENSFYIPVFIRIDYNADLIPGTFADVWLIGEEIHDALAVPNTAIMEEFGSYYVFIETIDGDYVKQYFNPGPSDGRLTQVLSGLHEGDLIVVEGAYQVKLSLMGSSPDDQHQGHSH
jgi:RND family efflux transporter MFP subunit